MIERLRNAYHWHILGQCRKHDKVLDHIKIKGMEQRGEFCDTVFYCHDCETERIQG